ncbi:MAG: CHASE domain-containing protein, partial [Proteobacteria bacterium]|nr:CHASE domain-containing protein [Pseudomonadota bacterium]
MTPPPPNDMPSRPSRLHGLLIPLLIFAAGLALTHVVQRTLHLRSEAALREEFTYRVDDLVGNIRGRLAAYEEILAGVGGLFTASRSVERGDFRAYVRALKLESRYPGVQGVGFASWIPAAERERHVHAVRAEGFPGYDIRPPGQRDWYAAILYLEPFDWRNQRAFGYDMYSEPVRRAAMERAADEDVTSISGRVRLVQETERDGQAGFLMYLPVYRTGVALDTRAQRRMALQGWVYAPFRMNDLMSGLLGSQPGELGAALGLKIYDGDGRDEDALMFDSAASFDASRALHRVERAIEVDGRRWTVVAHSLPAFDARLNVDEAALVLITGVLGSGLLGGIAWLMLTARTRALAMAERMTVELRLSEARHTAVFENMSNAVALFRASGDGRDFYFSAFNRAAERIDRVSRGEVLGRRVQDVFPGVADIGLLDAMRRVWQSGNPEDCPACFYAD